MTKKLTAVAVKSALLKNVKPGKAEALSRYFKTGRGQYGEGDKFIGVMVPEQRRIAKQYSELPLPEISKLLNSKIHEHRLTALLILVEQFQKADIIQKQVLVKYYLSQEKFINNWDLVDLSASKILGVWVILKKDYKLLDKLAKSKNMWQQRIAMVATSALIREKQLEHTWRLAEKFIKHKHDLMHKASGWMLREAGKVSQKELFKFLEQHAQNMPRVMLRYSIEKLSDIEKKHFLAKK